MQGKAYKHYLQGKTPCSQQETYRCKLVAVTGVASRGEIKTSACHDLVNRRGNNTISKTWFKALTDVVHNDVTSLAPLVLSTDKDYSSHRVGI